MPRFMTIVITNPPIKYIKTNKIIVLFNFFIFDPLNIHILENIKEFTKPTKYPEKEATLIFIFNL